MFHLIVFPMLIFCFPMRKIWEELSINKFHSEVFWTACLFSIRIIKMQTEHHSWWCYPSINSCSFWSHILVVLHSRVNIWEEVTVSPSAWTFPRVVGHRAGWGLSKAQLWQGCSAQFQALGSATSHSCAVCSACDVSGSLSLCGHCRLMSTWRRKLSLESLGRVLIVKQCYLSSCRASIWEHNT